MSVVWRVVSALFVAMVFTGAAVAGDLDGAIFRVTLESGPLGPLETQLVFEEAAGAVRARSLSGALGPIRDLPGARGAATDLSSALFALEASPAGEGYAGSLVAPWTEAVVRFALSGDRIEGTIEGGLFGGSFAGARAAEVRRLRDYPSILEAFDTVVRAKIFDPRDLETEAYRVFRERLGAVGAVARDDLDLVLGFRFGWTNDPFSHFELRRSAAPAEAMMKHFDGFRVGQQAARVELDGDLAVLRVDTMMGNDTIEYVEAAYDQIARAGSRALIVDLRGNEGGAFAVKPLLEHVIDEPMDAGYFMSQKWNGVHDRLPSAEELGALEPWTGWSVSAFWRSVQDEGLVRIRMTPAQPNFDGPVFVVVDGRSASATELAADGFRASGLATLVGEQTMGHMLSQSFFDVTDGYLVSLPVADYCSVTHGRIEGVGVPVDVEAPSDVALDRARALARAALAGQSVDHAASAP